MLSVLNFISMRTKDLVTVFGTVAAVGEQFGISSSAVSQWGAIVPRRRENELRGIHPDIDERIAAVMPKKKDARNGQRRAV